MSAQVADVVIPIYRDVELTRACIHSVLRCSAASVGRLILVDDCGPEREMRPMLRGLRDAEPKVRLVENERNLGFVGSANRGLSLAEHDVVLLNSDTTVTEGWLEELLGVLDEDSRIAAVSPLSNNATLCSVPDYGRGIPPEELRAANPRLDKLPRWTPMPTAVGFCMLFRRTLLDLLGGFDPIYGTGYNEENDWCQRAQSLGFLVARANRALVYHSGQVSFGDARDALDAFNARQLVSRYPHYLEQNRSFERGPRAREASVGVHASLGSLKVCLDTSHVIAPRIHGTAVYASELAEALGKLGGCQLTVRVANEAMAEHFHERGLATLGRGAALEGFHLVHRPSQVYELADARELLAAEGHVVLTWQDLIAYRAPGALKSWRHTEQFRALTWACVHSAQGLLSVSETAKEELTRVFGLDPARVAVTPLGFDSTRAPTAEQVAAVRAKRALERDYVAWIGSDYTHKNLLFLVHAWAVARAQLGEEVELVLAGPPSHVRNALYDYPGPLPPGVRVLGELPDVEVLPVLAGARALAFPSAYEGFGLPLLEAMGCQVPIIALPLSATPEVADGAALLVDTLTPQAFAHALIRVLGDQELRARLVASASERVARYTWRRTAEATLEAYTRFAQSPARASMLARDALRVLLAPA